MGTDYQAINKVRNDLNERITKFAVRARDEVNALRNENKKLREEIQRLRVFVLRWYALECGGKDIQRAYMEHQAVDNDALQQ